MNKDVRDYSDKSGNLIQKYANGRYNAVDSSFLTTNYFYQSYIANNDSYTALTRAYNFIENNKFIRYKHNESFNLESRMWNDPRTCSRDNSMGVICCLVEMNHTKHLRLFAKDIIKRGMLFQNTLDTKGSEKNYPADYCIAEWAVLYRGVVGEKYRALHYPILLMLDILFLLSVIIHLITNWFEKDYNSPLFHLVSQVECVNRNTSTFGGKLARVLLYNCTPHCPGYEHEEAVVSQLMEYSRMDYDPPIYDITAKVIRKYRE